MVERIQEGKTAPIPETKFQVLEQTTLKELGIDPYYDSLNLAADSITLGVNKDGEITTYFAFLDHPLAEEHFVSYLNILAPFWQARQGIVDDISLPILANRDIADGKNESTSGYVQLHREHWDDPRVGPPYKRFAEDHARAWLGALNKNISSQVFECLQRIRFVSSGRALQREFFSDDLDIDNISSKDLLNRINALKDLRGDNANLIPEDFLDQGDKETVADTLKRLFREEEEEFAVQFFMYARGKNPKGGIIVDLEKHSIRSFENDYPDTVGEVRVEFAENGRDVIISDGNQNTRVVVSPAWEGSKKFSWKVKEYNFPEIYLENSLFPFIAWRKDQEGKRMFLTQKEAIPFIERLGLPHGKKGDTKLGEIAVGIFSPEITQRWEKEMTLSTLGDRYVPQEMRGGNIAGWVAIERHARQLLRSETSILAALENYAGAFT